MKDIVIDGRGHLFGRLCSVVAHEILRGNRITVVRCEEIEKGGSFGENRIKFHKFLRKTRNSNPRRGHIHYHAPSRIFWRCVRGMVPHKLSKGADAMGRLKVFDGIPHPYDEKKKVVIPDALRKYTKTTNLGELASICGWTKGDIISELEDKRRTKALTWYKNKQDAEKKLQDAHSRPAVKKINEELAKYGF